VGFIKVTGNIVLIDCVAITSSESEIVMKLHDIVTRNTAHIHLCAFYVQIQTIYPYCTPLGKTLVTNRRGHPNFILYRLI